MAFFWTNLGRGCVARMRVLAPSAPAIAGEGDHWSSRSERTVVEGAPASELRYRCREFSSHEEASERKCLDVPKNSCGALSPAPPPPPLRGGPPPPLSRGRMKSAFADLFENFCCVLTQPRRRAVGGRPARSECGCRGRRRLWRRGFSVQAACRFAHAGNLRRWDSAGTLPVRVRGQVEGTGARIGGRRFNIVHPGLLRTDMTRGLRFLFGRDRLRRRRMVGVAVATRRGWISLRQSKSPTRTRDVQGAENGNNGEA